MEFVVDRGCLVVGVSSMPDAMPSQYNQASFIGGMNLIVDDSRLQPNQYRIGFNTTNRYDELDLLPSSVEDTSVPAGPMQGVCSFGNYLILFVGGNAYYRYYNAIGWTMIQAFTNKMSQTASRYWTCAVPVSTTNYVRYSVLAALPTDVSTNTTPNPAGGVLASAAAGAAGGNLPGLLVQDNISQPVFIFLDQNGFPTARVTQTFAQWSITFTDDTGDIVKPNGDQREYVPVGNCMTWDDGILYVVSQDLQTIYRSVSGRSLDFVVNVVNTLPVASAFKQVGGGDATTTSTSVGVGNISCIRNLSSGGIFVSASGANFSLIPNKTPGAVTVFGEYTFIRTFLFNAFCLSDRAIIDSQGDTKFIDLGGVRSFNAVEQLQNEGRNSPFSSQIQPIFSIFKSGKPIATIVQNGSISAAGYFDNYEVYGMQTLFGPALCKYDTVNSCWCSIDLEQLDSESPLQFVAMQIDVLALFAITTNNRLFQLYASTTKQDTGVFRSVGVCSNLLYANYNVKMNNPDKEVKLVNARLILNKITEDCTASCIPFINNRVYDEGAITKVITYEEPSKPYSDPYTLPDVDTQLTNILFPTPNAAQGWKAFCQFSWTGGVVTQYSMELTEMTPINPLQTQASTI